MVAATAPNAEALLVKLKWVEVPPIVKSVTLLLAVVEVKTTVLPCMAAELNPVSCPIRGAVLLEKLFGRLSKRSATSAPVTLVGAV